MSEHERYKWGGSLAAKARFVPALRLCRRLAAVLGLYLVLAIAMLAPLANSFLPESPAQDLCCHVSGIVEARNAWREGQFPLRIAPHQNDRERYPYLQCYCNLPYTLGGLVYHATNWDPYLIWKMSVAGMLTVGGFFTYLCARRFTRQELPAAVAGAAFVTSPYMLIDVQARFAYPETAAFCLLPVVFYYASRSFARPELRSILLAAISWAALALSHNVILMCASLFFALYFVSYLRLTRRYFARATRVGAGYLLGLCLAAWYIAPHFYIHHHLAISNCRGAVSYTAWLVTLGGLLAPTMVFPAPMPCLMLHKTRLGLQVGWPLLAGVALALHHTLAGRHVANGGRLVVVRLAILFFVALVMARAPFDLWRFLPSILCYVLYPYRMLSFVVLWGALLVAYALATSFQGSMRAEHLALCLLILGLAAGPYLPVHQFTDQVTVEGEIANPNMGRGGGNAVFRLTPEFLAGNAMPLIYGINLADWGYGIISSENRLCFPGTGMVSAPRQGDTILLEGLVPIQHGRPITLRVTLGDELLTAVTLPPGPFKVKATVPREYNAERVPLTIQADQYLDMATQAPCPPLAGRLTCAVTRLTFRPGPGRTKVPVLLPAEETAPSTHYGHWTTCHLAVDAPAVAQLPVLFYPDLLEVRDNGHKVAYGNLGRFVALELTKGNHFVAVRFVGVPWANRLSGTAAVLILMLLATALVWPVARRSVFADATTAITVMPSVAQPGHRKVA